MRPPVTERAGWVGCQAGPSGEVGICHGRPSGQATHGACTARVGVLGEGQLPPRDEPEGAVNGWQLGCTRVSRAYRHACVGTPI